MPPAAGFVIRPQAVSHYPPSPLVPEKQQKSDSIDLKLAGCQMIKIATAVFLLRAVFHMAPKGVSLLLKSTEKQALRQADNRLLKAFNGRIRGIKTFLETRSKERGSSLYKSLMAIMDGFVMLYVGEQIDHYFCKKHANFKPKEGKDPEKMVDKVLLALIATERMESLMHHLFYWLDKAPSSGRRFIYGELAALSAVLLDTTVKVASDRYRLRKNARNPNGHGGPVSRTNSIQNPLI